jgi:hypothetical protein
MGPSNSWARDNSRAVACINAKAETIDTRGAFRDDFAHRRFVIPADEFYSLVLILGFIAGGCYYVPEPAVSRPPVISVSEHARGTRLLAHVRANP